MSDDAIKSVEERDNDMTETMGEVFDRMNAPDTPEAAPDTKAAPEVEAAPVKPEGDRQRGPDGKFIKAEEAPVKAAPAKEPAPKAEVTTDQAEPGKDVTPASKPVVAPPPSWSGDAKTAWATLPAAVQQAVAKREQEASAGIKSYSDRVKAFEPIEQALQPVLPRIQLNGISPAQYVRSLVAADNFLRERPAEALQWISQQYGIDLQNFVSTQQPAEREDAVHPQIAALAEQVKRLTTHIETNEQRNQEAATTSLQQSIDNFRDALSEDGSPKHPFFEDVKTDMAALLQGGRAQTLDDAYDMAIYANRDIRARVLADQEAKREAQRQAEAATRLKDAKRVAGTNLSSRGAVSGSPAAPKSWEEGMGEVYDRMNGGAA